MNPRHNEVAERADRRCEYCHAPEAIFNFSLEVEHILPLAAGGADSLDNLALACRSCNAFKSYRQVGIDAETGQTAPLFHPRQNVWEEHFIIDNATETLLGLTPQGRATVAQLQLNSAEQRQARALWRQLQRFP